MSNFHQTEVLLWRDRVNFALASSLVAIKRLSRRAFWLFATAFIHLCFYDCASRSKSAIRTYIRGGYNLSLMLRCCGCVCGLELAASSVPFDPPLCACRFPPGVSSSWFFIMFLIIRQQNTVTLRCANSGIRATWKLFGGFAHRRWHHKS